MEIHVIVLNSGGQLCFVRFYLPYLWLHTLSPYQFVYVHYMILHRLIYEDNIDNFNRNVLAIFIFSRPPKLALNHIIWKIFTVRVWL
ncbi:hypothetical protein ACJX0J_006922, partial [Zea mays]